MLKEIVYVFGSFCFSLGFVYIVWKKLNEIRKICIGSEDESVKGIVVGKKTFLYTGDVHPIVSCKIKGSEILYQYRFYYNLSQFPLGKEVDLKVSRISGIPYDKKDLIKDILLHVFFLIICILGTVAGCLCTFRFS